MLKSMLKRILRLTVLLSILILTSCKSDGIEKTQIDEFIKKYQDESFDSFKDVFVAIRGSNTLLNNIYIVSKCGGNLPVYFVTYNFVTNSITEINKSALTNSNVKDYFTEKEINTIITNFRKYDFYLLGVDSDGNVFINPFKTNAPAYFLKLKDVSNQKKIKKGYVYTHYKNNWYINNTE